MATIKTGWLKTIVNGVSTRVYAISHAKCCYYGDPADGITVNDKIDETNERLGDQVTFSLDGTTLYINSK